MALAEIASWTTVPIQLPHCTPHSNQGSAGGQSKQHWTTQQQPRHLKTAATKTLDEALASRQLKCEYDSG